MGKIQRRIVRAINRENSGHHRSHHDGDREMQRNYHEENVKYQRRLLRRQQRRDAYERKILRSKSFFAGLIKKVRKALKGE